MLYKIEELFICTIKMFDNLIQTFILLPLAEKLACLNGHVNSFMICHLYLHF